MVPFADERDHVYLHPAEFIQMDLIPLSSLSSLSSMLLINRPFRASQAFPGQDVFVHKSVLPGSLESWNGHQLGWLQLCSLEGVVSHGMYVHSPSNRSLRAFFWGHFLLKQRKVFVGKKNTWLDVFHQAIPRNDQAPRTFGKVCTSETSHMYFFAQVASLSKEALLLGPEFGWICNMAEGHSTVKNRSKKAHIWRCDWIYVYTCIYYILVCLYECSNQAGPKLTPGHSFTYHVLSASYIIVVAPTWCHLHPRGERFKNPSDSRREANVSSRRCANHKVHSSKAPLTMAFWWILVVRDWRRLPVDGSSWIRAFGTVM